MMLKFKYLFHCEDTHKKCTRKSVSLSWLNSDIHNCMGKKRPGFKNCIKLNTDNLIYKGLRNKAVQELGTSKVTHCTQSIKNTKGQSTVLWKQTI